MARLTHRKRMGLQTVQAIKRQNPLQPVISAYKRLFKGIVGALTRKEMHKFFAVIPPNPNSWDQKNRGKSKLYQAWKQQQETVKS